MRRGWYNERARWPVWKTYVDFGEHAAKGERRVWKKGDAGGVAIVRSGVAGA